MYALLLLNLICPFVMILVGLILKKRPAANMRRQNGYNTPTSRKSQAHWDYAQKIAPGIFIVFGGYSFAAEIIVSAVLFLLRVLLPVSLIIGTIMGFGFLFCAFHYTDKKIKRNFADKENNDI